jgi:PAS domain-containing protein
MEYASEHEQVTASDLVRSFGLWQDRAARHPVYVVHRGRPKLVLLSIEIMDALCSRTETPEVSSGDQVAALIDNYEEAVILLDPSAVITHVNRAGRARFTSAKEGRPLADLSRNGSALIGSTVKRVIQSGTSETLHISSPDRLGRELTITIDAIPGGCMVVARDATAVEELFDSELGREAILDAIEASGRTATFRLNQRAALVEPRAAFAAMIGATLEHLPGTRLMALIAVSDRKRVSEMIEHVFDAGGSASEEIEFLVEGGRQQQAILSLAGARTAARRDEIAGTLSLL